MLKILKCTLTTSLNPRFPPIRCSNDLESTSSGCVAMSEAVREEFDPFTRIEITSIPSVLASM